MKHSLENLVANTELGLFHRARDAQNETPSKAPALILLHGVGSNEANLIDVALRQDPRLVVILARGPLTFGPMQFGWFHVNFTQEGPKINAAQAEQSRQALISFTERLPGAYNVDPKRIWIAGFSQGGIMSASVALTAPDKVAGFGLLSGRVLPEISPLIADNNALSQLNAFVSHGIYDQKLGIHFARNAQGLLQERGVPLHYQEYEAGHELNEAMQRDFGEWMNRQLVLNRS
jgi:phospholipase/carboxylesterase